MVEQHSSYLERIVFDSKLLTSRVAAYVGNIRIVLLLVLTIAFLGIFSYFNLPRRLNPEIKIPIITVISVLPGAAPEDVESLVTIPLENELRGLTGLDTITSSSRENVSAISMQFFSTVSQDKAKADVQSVVDSITGLPTDVQTPKVTALDFENQPIWTFAIKSNNDDLPSLMRFARIVQDKIEDEPKVDHVTLRGYETQEIVVTVSPEKVRQYGINPLTLAASIKTAVNAFPAGQVNSEQNSFAVTIDPSVQSVADLRRIRISIGASVLQLGDIANISERSKNGQLAAYLADRNNGGSRIVTFDVYKIQSARIDESAAKVQTIVKEALAMQNDRFQLLTVTNAAEEVSRQFTDLLGEFRSTIILVFACLFLFLGLRQATIAVFTVPLTFLSAFVFMQILGMSINFLSLFAFLLALGLLIDDTIVVVSAMTTYYKTGKFTAYETGLIVWRDTIVPIWSTTITTIWSFVPLLLSAGIIGEFIKPIPVVVSVTMISSTAIAVLVTLPFMIVLLKPTIARRVRILVQVVGVIILLGVIVSLVRGNPFFLLIIILYGLFLFVALRVGAQVRTQIAQRLSQNQVFARAQKLLVTYSNHGVLDIEVLSRKYYRLILRVLASKRARRIVVSSIVIYALVAFLLLPIGLVKNEFFPKTDSKTLYVSLEMPAGTKLELTQQAALGLLDQLRVVPNTEFTVLELGRGVSSFTGSGGENNNNALFTLHLPDKKNRKVASYDIATELRKQLTTQTEGKVSVVEQTSGPPAGSDLQLKLLGDDLGVLNQYADKLVAYLQTQAGVTNIEKSIKPGTSAIIFVPDPQKVALAGLTTDALGLWLRTYASGFTLDEVNFDTTSTQKENIVFKFDNQPGSLDTISAISIPSLTGPLPLLSLGTLTTKANPTSITREGGKRSISVSASVTQGYSVSDKNKEFVKFANSIELPEGYSWKTGGVNEENAKSVQSILQAMIVAFILILVTMVIQFHSYRQAIIVLLVIPLAVSSVFMIFALTGTPLSFPALIGVLSLFGIVVTNSMFIVDKINLNLREGMPFNEAIADAGASRLEPIILTKLCTVLGLLPITLAEPLWRGLGGAIISGILVSSTIMLLFIPVVYYSWFKPQKNS